MSNFTPCEYRDDVADQISNCSSTSRFFGKNHIIDHTESEGAHPTQEALLALSDEEVSMLQRAKEQYQIECTQQAISRMKERMSILEQNMRSTEQECLSSIDNIMNGDMKKNLDDLCFKRFLPVFSSSSLTKRLVSLKQSGAFCLQNLLQEFVSLSLSPSKRVISDELSSCRAFPSVAFPSQETELSTRNASCQASKTSKITIQTFSTQTPPTSEFFAPTQACSKTEVFAQTQTSPTTELFAPAQTSPTSEFSIQTFSVECFPLQIRPHSIFSPETPLKFSVQATPECSISPPRASETETTLQWDLFKDFKPHNREITCIAVSDCQKYFASASRDNTVKIWESGTFVPIRTLYGHTRWVTSISFLGKGIVSGSCDNTIKIWEESRCIRTLTLHYSYVYALCVSNSQRLIASGDSGGLVIVYSIENNKTVCSFKAHFNWIRSIVFTQDDKEIVTGSGDSNIKIWRTETGELLKTLLDYPGQILCVGLYNNLIAASSSNKAVKIWNKDQKDSLVSLRGHTGQVQSVDIYENMVASLSDDNSIRLWNVQNGELIQTLKAHGTHNGWYVGSLKFLEGGRWIVSGGADSRIKIWRRRT